MPGFDFEPGYTAFQFCFVLVQSAAFGGVFTGFGIARDFEYGFARRLLLAAPNRTGIVLGYAIAALVRWSLTATVLTVVALFAGMNVFGGPRRRLRDVRAGAPDQHRRAPLGGRRRDALPDDAGRAGDADARLPGALLRAGLRPARRCSRAGSRRSRRSTRSRTCSRRCGACSRGTRSTSRSRSRSPSGWSAASPSGRCAACARRRRRGREVRAAAGLGRFLRMSIVAQRQLGALVTELGTAGFRAWAPCARSLAVRVARRRARARGGGGRLLGGRGGSRPWRRLPLRARRPRGVAGPVLPLAARRRPGPSRVVDPAGFEIAPGPKLELGDLVALRAPRRHVLGGGHVRRRRSHGSRGCATSESPRSS